MNSLYQRRLKDYYRISNDQKEIDEAIRDLRGYWKTLGILYLKKLKLPSLNGVVIINLSDIVYNEIIKFCNKNSYNYLLLRHDKKPEKPPYPMGGYLVKIDKIKEEVRSYFNAGRIVILLEPSNFLDNLYSFNIRFESKKGSALIEIVGPGFDASDLQRGHTTPHESILINLTALEEYINKHDEDFILNKAIESRYFLNRSRYIQSVRDRYEKIGERLLKLGEIGEDDYRRINKSEKIRLVRNYLIEKNHKLLVNNDNIYRPISNKLLVKILEETYNLPKKLNQLINSNEFILSGGFIWSSNRINFWDIVIPKLKYSSFTNAEGYE